MSKMILAGVLSFAALSVMGLSSFYDQKFGVGTGIDPIITTGIPQFPNGENIQSIADGSNIAPLGGDMFILTGNQSDELCIFERAPLEGQRHAQVRIDTDCAPLYPELTKVVHWRERPDGLIDLVDASGRPVMTFANTDGASYQTLEPSAIHLTFSPI